MTHPTPTPPPTPNPDVAAVRPTAEQAQVEPPTRIRSGRVGPTCPNCGHIHCGTDVIAVGRFDPNGVRGYTPRVGGDGHIYRTREEAMSVVCANRQVRRGGL